jgi:DNA-directed RNA polymerase specialized sigma24 family protein
MNAMIVDEEQQPDREAKFLSLYLESFPAIARYISKMGGSFEEAKDVFQDALVIYYEKTQFNKPVFTQGEKAYLFGIARHLWNKRHKENSKTIPFDRPGTEVEEEAALTDSPYEEISAPRLLNLLSKAGEKCMRLLSAFYYENLDMETLAKRFGFAGARSATAQKFKCLEKVKETVKKRALQYEDIIE